MISYGYIELLSQYLTEPGAFQDDRLDQIDDDLRTRFAGTEELLSVIGALQRADPEEGTPENLRLILKGMYPDDQVPDQRVIEQSLNFLAHPSIQLAEYTDGQYQPITTTANAKIILRRFGALVDEVSDSKESAETSSIDHRS